MLFWGVGVAKRISMLYNNADFQFINLNEAIRILDFHPKRKDSKRKFENSLKALGLALYVGGLKEAWLGDGDFHREIVAKELGLC